jgi:hypothetical protein
MRKLISLALSALLLAAPAIAGDGWERDSAYGKSFNPQSIITVTGKVVSVNHNTRPLPGMGAGVSSVVQTADGKTYDVQIGPAWFTEFYHARWNLQPGDTVTVIGSQTTIGGKPVVMLITGEKGELKMTVRGQTGTPIWDLKSFEF